MKMQYPLCTGGRIVEVEGATQEDLFRELAGAVEVFGETHCGECGEGDIVPIAREAKGHEFFEWACLNCGARLTMGVRNDKSGRLFPVRKLLPSGKPDWETGTAGDHRGWTKYRGDASTAHGTAGPRTPPPTQRAPAAASAPAPVKAAASAPAPVKAAAHAPASPAPGPVGAPLALLTEEQREAIGNALRVSGIGRQTFLAWCGYRDPSLIPQTEYAALLAAAKKPPRDLLSMAATGKRP